MQNAVLLCGLLLLVGVNYLYRRDVVYPATVFAAVWLFAAAVYVFFPFEIDQIGWTAVAVITGGCATFSIGCLLGNRPLLRGQSTWFTNPSENPQPRLLLLLYVLITVPLVTYSMMKLAGLFHLSPELFITAREEVVNAQTDGRAVYDNPLVTSAPTIAVSVAFIQLIDARGRWSTTLAVLATVILGVLTTGRVILMLMFSGWVFLSMLKKRDHSVFATVKPLFLSTVLVLVLATGLSLLTKTETQEGGSSIAVQMTATYIGAPIAGLNYAIAHPESFEASNYSFAQLLGPLSTLGVHFRNPPAFDPFLPVPFPINVFTAYKDYYVDFGLTGCLSAFLVFGFITGLLFNASIRGNRVAQFFSAYLFYALLLSPFQNAYNLFGRYTYVSLFAVGYFVLLQHVPRIRVAHAKFRLFSGRSSGLDRRFEASSPKGHLS
jgi:oligosaccharide repeat unit polymerase